MDMASLDKLLAEFPSNPTHLIMPWRTALAVTGENAAHRAVAAAGDRDRRRLKRIAAKARRQARQSLIQDRAESLGPIA